MKIENYFIVVANAMTGGIAPAKVQNSQKVRILFLVHR